MAVIEQTPPVLTRPAPTQPKKGLRKYWHLYAAISPSI